MAKGKNLTPMMEQYWEIKNEYPEALLFYRLGDFYELFYKDAIIASEVLEITLTARNKNAEDPVPMCGVPYHSAKAYIRTLVERGFKVAICEQLEDAKEAKGMVKRGVIRVVTPGTAMEDDITVQQENNFICAVDKLGSGASAVFALAYADLATGEIKTTLMDQEEIFKAELAAINPKEIIINPDNEELNDWMEANFDGTLSFKQDHTLDQDYSHLLKNLELGTLSQVSTRLINYLYETQMTFLGHLQVVEAYEVDYFLYMDRAAKQNLELLSALRSQKKEGSLFALLDRTKTAMGRRELKKWIERPLIVQSEIERRLDMVESFTNHYFDRLTVTDNLKQVYDLERLVAKIAFATVNAREINQLCLSLEQIPAIKESLRAIGDDAWEGILNQMVELPELVQLIRQAITDDPGISVKEGGIIRDGFNAKLDQYRDASANGKNWIAELQARERNRTGIKSLKVGYNKVFGYYIEVTKANLDQLKASGVEDEYDRKQTLVNAERFITPELKEKEALILNADENSADLEYELFVKLRNQIKTYTEPLQILAKAISQVDVLQAFAEVSEDQVYVRPTFNKDRYLAIESGRHPIVEHVLGRENYVPNDIVMDQDLSILLITGPNMSGKSTYMRQLAITVIMAQMGCFVPAKMAQLPIFDKIFTRIGASDDLASGQSTFMVEMMETQHALVNLTDDSLVLFDEIGRGTSTYDGMALAEAILRYVHHNSQAKVLFSTHYHELTELESTLERLKNVHVGAVEEDDDIVFLHQMLDGPTDKSYGIYVAKLAGMPEQLLSQAKKILNDHEASQAKLKQGVSDQPIYVAEAQDNSAYQDLANQLDQLDLNQMTPMEALLTLQDLKHQVKDIKG